MKQSSWIFHVPTQLQDQIIETAKLGTRTPIVSYDDEVEVESDFSIEYYPLTKRYYPKYKNKYLKTSFFN